MVWGTPIGSRHAATRDPDLELGNAPPPPTAQCSNCERWAVLAAGCGGKPQLPRGWVEIDGEALCGDCAPKPVRRAKKPEQRRLHQVGPLKDAKFGGCRIAHEIALDTVGLRIHAGASARFGARDEPVQFFLTAEGIDQLIIHLGEIRGELTSRAARPAAAGGGALQTKEA